MHINNAVKCLRLLILSSLVWISLWTAATLDLVVTRSVPSVAGQVMLLKAAITIRYSNTKAFLHSALSYLQQADGEHITHSNKCCDSWLSQVPACKHMEKSISTPCYDDMWEWKCGSWAAAHIHCERFRCFWIEHTFCSHLQLCLWFSSTNLQPVVWLVLCVKTTTASCEISIGIMFSITLLKGNKMLFKLPQATQNDSVGWIWPAGL